MAGVGSHTGGWASTPRCASSAVSDAAPLIFIQAEGVLSAPVSCLDGGWAGSAGAGSI